MAESRIDRDKLRAYLRKLPGEDLLVMLDRAIDLLPETRLPKLIKDYAWVEQFKADGTSPVSLLDAVKRFHAASLRGEYFEDFDVNWRNCTQHSRGTQVWIAECLRLVDLCLKAAKRGQHVEARTALDLIFDLLRKIDDGSVDIIFFADEAGSWQVGVDWRTVLPVWFRCAAKTASPEEYVAAVRGAIEDFAPHEADHLLEAAKRAGTKEQRAGLVETLTGGGPHR